MSHWEYSIGVKKHKYNSINEDGVNEPFEDLEYGLVECFYDDEGDGYQVVSNTADVFFVDRDDSGYYIEQIYDEVDVLEYEINAEKVVIIN